MNAKRLTIGLSIAVLVVLAFALGGGRFVVKEVVTSLGVSSPEISSPYIKYGDIERRAARVALNTATTTPCAIQSPSATSTLVHASLSITTATSTATTWTVAKATTAYATTTSLGSSIALASGKFGTMTASTTFNGLADDTQIIAPNNYIVWGVAGIGNLTSDKLLGTCQAEFIVTGR